MTALLNHALPFLLAILCFVLAGLFPNDAKVHEGLLGGAAFMMGVAVPLISDWFKRKPNDAGHGSLAIFFLTMFTSVVMLFGVLLTSPGCHQVKPDQFFEAVIDCAKINPERSSASAAVITCVIGAAAGNAVACIAGLPTTAHWTIDESACVIADIARQENVKVGTAAGSPESLALRNEAVRFLSDHRIRVENSYAGAP
jgi:hypothetical protein